MAAELLTITAAPDLAQRAVGALYEKSGHARARAALADAKGMGREANRFREEANQAKRDAHELELEVETARRGT